MTTKTLKTLLLTFKKREDAMSLIFGFAAIAFCIYFVGAQFQTFRKRMGSIPPITETPSIVAEHTELPKSLDLVQLPAMYVVNPGDTTWKVAEAFYGVGQMYTIVEEANQLQPDQQLETNMKLTIPQVDQTLIDEMKQKAVQNDSSLTQQPAQQKMHLTTPSDTLWKLAQQYYNDGYKWTKIYDANKSLIKNPNKLEKGLRLVIPE